MLRASTGRQLVTNQVKGMEKLVKCSSCGAMQRAERPCPKCAYSARRSFESRYREFYKKLVLAAAAKVRRYPYLDLSTAEDAVSKGITAVAGRDGEALRTYLLEQPEVEGEVIFDTTEESLFYRLLKVAFNYVRNQARRASNHDTEVEPPPVPPDQGRLYTLGQTLDCARRKLGDSKSQHAALAKEVCGLDYFTLTPDKLAEKLEVEKTVAYEIRRLVSDAIRDCSNES